MQAKSKSSKKEAAKKREVKAETKTAQKKAVSKKQQEKPVEEESKGESATESTHNGMLAAEFAELAKYYNNQGDKFRAKAYGSAATKVKNHETQVKSVDDVAALGLSDKLAKKARELIESGKLEKYNFIKTDPKVQVINMLADIWGVGPKAAEKLYASGIRTIEQLREKTELLTTNQKIGLKYYEDLKEKIPREEATQIFQYVQKEAFTSFKLGPMELEVVACGSYRRGKPLCGDVDILISRRDKGSIEETLGPLVEALKKSGFMREALGKVGKKEKGGETFMGICQLPGEGMKCRRIDIKTYPREQFGFALLYFTGSARFNIELRNEAIKQGYSLSDFGLTPKNKNKASKACETEKEVFELMGLPYKEPK